MWQQRHRYTHNDQGPRLLLVDYYQQSLLSDTSPSLSKSCAFEVMVQVAVAKQIQRVFYNIFFT